MFRITYALVFVLVMARAGVAQTTAAGSVRGVATDEQGALLPGVAVSATSPTVPGVYAATTDRDGRYRLVDLPPGDYTIVAERSGFARFQRSPVTLRSGLTLEVDIVLTVGGIDEVVEVRLETPLLETQHGGRTVNLSGALLRSLPLSERREWFGALTLAPGVTTAEWAANERLFYVHGAESNANIIQIDGADVSPALISGVRYVGLNTDAIDDIQVKTAGVDASAPLGLGGIINIATASGTNSVKGAATLFVQPRAWNGSNTPGGTSSTVDQVQADVSLGAPVVANRLWAFGSYRFTDVSTGISRTAGQLDVLRALIPGFRPFDATNRSQFWFGKLTAQLSASHQISGFYQYDVNPVTSADAAAEHARSDATGGSGASLRLSSVWGDRLTTRAGASYNDKRRDGENPGIDGPVRRVYQSTIASGGRLTGNGRLADRGSPVLAWNTQPNSKLTLSFDATLLLSGWLGSHDLQTGVYAQPRIHIGSHNFYVNGGYTLEDSVLRRPNAFDEIVPFHRTIMDGTEVTTIRQRGQDVAFYAQDAWRPTDRLTINAGLRIDRIVWRDDLFGVTTQRSVEVGPRFGVNYAMTADARNVLRAHWVRVHSQPSENATSVGSSRLGSRDLYDLNLDGTFETVFVTPSAAGLTGGRTIVPDLHQPFIHEWGGGYSRQFAGNTVASIDLVRRSYRDRLVFVETNARYDGTVFAGYLDENVNAVYELANGTWNTPVYSSVELSLTRRTARLQGIASYVRQWRHLEGTWQPNDPAAIIQPDAFANDKGIGLPTSLNTALTDVDSLSGHSMAQRATAAGQWQDHVARLGVSYTAPWKLLLATHYTFQSGVWSGPIVTRIAAPDPAFGPSTVRLSNGRTVSNPLATVLRFAYPTRGDGQLKTPAMHAWNVRAGRTFTWRGIDVDASLDVFNVTNNGADASFNVGANQTFSPLYGTMLFRQLPRSAQAVVRVSF